MKKLFPAMIVGFALSLAAGATPVFAQQTMKSEKAHHPRIAKAIRELEEAIKYMEAAPHDFGGHRAKAIADSRAAIDQLRLALAYREVKDNAKKK